MATTTAQSLISPHDVLLFWFGTLDTETLNSVTYIEERMGVWFGGKSTEFDKVQRNHANLLTEVAECVSEDWTSPSGYLAKVILLDQFSRCIFRGTKHSFQFDELVASLVQDVIQKGWLTTEYSPIQRFFFGVGIQHSENLEMQTVGVGLARELTLAANPELRSFFSQLKGYPHEHFDVIQRFGRFPSRNLVLGRESTLDEIAWLTSPDCPAWATTQQPKMIRVGLVAFGVSGKIFHVPFVLTHPNFTLTAVFERNKNEAEEFLLEKQISHKISTVRSLQELVSREDVDLVVVCSPIEFHYQHARAALLAGKHVLVEKAFCSTSEEAAQLLDLAKTSGLVCMPYQNRRHDSDFRTLKLEIMGQLGDIVEFNGIYNRFSPHLRDSWKDTAPNSGGNFLSLGSHMIDQAVVLFGPPTAVWADIRSQRGGVLDDAWEVHLFYEKGDFMRSSDMLEYVHQGGFRAILKGSLLCPDHALRYLVHGRSGSWMKCGVDTQEDDLRKGRFPDYRATFVTSQHQLDDYLGHPSLHERHFGCEKSENWGLLTRTSSSQQEKIRSLPGTYHLLYDELAECILFGKPQRIDPSVAVTVLKIIELARESSKHRKVMEWGAEGRVGLKETGKQWEA
jgi:scyllo-inositol 2-dehydrogenase (NADP+)